MAERSQIQLPSSQNPIFFSFKERADAKSVWGVCTLTRVCVCVMNSPKIHKKSSELFLNVFWQNLNVHIEGFLFPLLLPHYLRQPSHVNQRQNINLPRLFKSTSLPQPRFVLCKFTYESGQIRPSVLVCYGFVKNSHNFGSLKQYPVIITQVGNPVALAGLSAQGLPGQNHSVGWPGLISGGTGEDSTTQLTQAAIPCGCMTEAPVSQGSLCSERPPTLSLM